MTATKSPSILNEDMRHTNASALNARLGKLSVNLVGKP